MSKVLMLTHYYFPHIGGNEGQCKLLAENIENRGNTVFVVTKRYIRMLSHYESVNGVQIYRVHCLSSILKKPFCDYISKFPDILIIKFIGKILIRLHFYIDEYLFMIFAYIKIVSLKNKFDIIHVHQTHWISFCGAIVSKFIKKPILVKDATLNGFNELRLMPFKTYMKKVIIKNSRFIAVSTDIKNNLLENGVKVENIFVIPNATNFPSKSNAHHSQDIIFVGNFEQGKIKGLDILIKSIIYVFKQNKESRLLIIGKGNSESFIKLLNNYPDFKHRVHFLGLVENASYFYLNSFIFVLPSRSEGMSNALLEAMSYGMPCISTRVSGSNDLIEDKKNGLLIPIEDELALADSILLLLNNKDLAKELGRNARSTIECFYKPEIVYTKYESLYKKLIND